jgi:hypothetical protein
MGTQPIQDSETSGLLKGPKECYHVPRNQQCLFILFTKPKTYGDVRTTQSPRKVNKYLISYLLCELTLHRSVSSAMRPNELTLTSRGLRFL